MTTDQPLSADQDAEVKAMERLSQAGFQCTNLTGDPHGGIPDALTFLRERQGYTDTVWLALDIGKLSTAARYDPANTPTTADDEPGGERLPALRHAAPAPLIDVVTEVLTWPEVEVP